MRKHFRKIFVAPVLASFLLLAGCQKATVVSDLNTAVSAIQVALPIIEAGGLLSGPAGLAISVAAAAIDSAATELASKDSPLQKAQFVNADVSKALSELPDPQSLPPTVAPRVAVIQAALQAVLVDVQNSRTSQLNPHMSFSGSDIRSLKKIAAQANDISQVVQQ